MTPNYTRCRICRHYVENPRSDLHRKVNSPGYHVAVPARPGELPDGFMQVHGDRLPWETK